MSESEPILQMVERRLVQLEVKASYSDDLLDTLNTLVAQQQRAIDTLTRQVQWLRQQTGDADSGNVRNLRDDVPPHY